MRVHESPNVPFSVMYTRLSQGTSCLKTEYDVMSLYPTAPSTVIYDNACNLHNYSLNREPLFFKDTWFLVDRFHWRNHKGML